MKLDLGCGSNKPQGFEWIGIDRVNTLDADIVQDLERDPELPFEDNDFMVVRARHFLEHLEEKSLKRLVEEVHRVLRPEGFFVVTVPHFLSWNSATVDHEHIFGSNSMDLFGDHDYPSQYGDLFEVRERHFVLEQKLPVVHHLSRVFSNELIARYVPNSVRELTFILEPIEGGDTVV